MPLPLLPRIPMIASPWQRCIARLEQECEERDLNLWLRPLHAEKRGDELMLLAPNQFVRREVEQRFLARIRELASGFKTRDYSGRVSLSVGSGYTPPAQNFPVADRTLPVRLVPGNPIDPNYRFDNFIEGPSNQMARAAALLVAEQPGGQYNPLFIYGGVGLGKTHLMHGLANHILSEKPEFRVAYLQSERFVNDMIHALQRGRIDAFKDQYRSLNVLLIDDIQFFAGKERSQEEFFHTFNTLMEGHHQIVLTSDRYPKEINGLEERLKSRFGWGLIAAVEPPELETRVAILMNKAQQQDVRLPEPVAFFLAQRISSNVRELEGALRRVLAMARFTSRPISVDLARTALKDLLAVQQKLITIENIQRMVANYFRIRPADLSSKSRSRSITRPRQIAMALAKELTRHSLPEIGDAFGGRDHSTVLHACRKIAELRANDAVIDDDYKNLLRLLSN